MGEAKRERLLARPRRRRKVSIKVGHREIGCDAMEWVNLAMDGYFGIFTSYWATAGFSRKNS
jgi:hypothetical protein